MHIGKDGVDVRPGRLRNKAINTLAAASIAAATTCCTLVNKMIDEAPLIVDYAERPARIIDWMYKTVQMQGNEFAVCLYGKRENGRWKVEDVRLTPNKEYRLTGVRYDYCDHAWNGLRYIGDLHSHPTHLEAFKDLCRPSNVDVDTFRKSKEPIMAIACWGVPPGHTGEPSVYVVNFDRRLLEVV